jgi:CII-binding regulator of phage lambda lysogenization HflD
LYFQLGGRRRHLFLQRRRLVGAAQALCEELP